ncbi:hypothetical protein [Halospeciosus flavus]|uniref:Lipoprotein n=1 Tax=Halospeciosus flavus TaxID=3032283 RepID=A0ABD5Z3E2_9EURY|nr:hypothetical protein [Halospeciosus flavus]
MLILAGCAGLSPPTNATSVAQPTASPNSTTNQPVHAELDQLPAGLNESGVANVSRVVAAHQANVARQPGQIVSRTNGSLGGLVVVANTTAVATANLTQIHYESQSVTYRPNRTTNRTTIITANATAMSQRVVVDGNVTLANTRNRTAAFDRALRGLSTATNPIRGALQRGNYTIAAVSTADGRQVITLRSTTYAGGKLFDDENVTQYNATIRLTQNGTVLSVTERIEGTTAGHKRHYYYSFEFTPKPVTPDLTSTQG